MLLGHAARLIYRATTDHDQDDQPPMSDSRTPLSAFLGMILCRALVPLWVLTGAVFKLIERDPTLLPKNIIDAIKIVARRFEEPTAVLDFVLRSFIGLELVAVVLMVLMARWARPVAIFMLGAFCLILIGEMVTGNFENCGCFGDLPVTPWQMLIADGALLLGAIFLRPAADRPPATTSRRPLLVAAVLTLAAFGTSFGVPGRTVVAPPVDGNGGKTPKPRMADGCPPLPGPGEVALNAMYWPIYDRDWVGECWTQTELAPCPTAPKWLRKGHLVRPLLPQGLRALSRADGAVLHREAIDPHGGYRRPRARGLPR